VGTNEEFNFWNRKKERQDIHSEINCFLYISTPPSYGKTYLLKQLMLERQERGWKHVFMFSLLELPITAVSSKDDFLDYISLQLGFENHVILAGYIMEKTKQVLILIDDIHVLAGSNNNQLKQVFLESMRFFMQRAPRASAFQLILAGRYIDSHSFRIKVPLNQFKKIAVNPFEKDAVYQIIEDYLFPRKIFFKEMLPTYEAWSVDIQTLSCGHPLAIINLVQHLVEKSSKTFLDSDYIAKNQEVLFDNYVKPCLNQMLVELSPFLQSTLEKLSVFNAFDAAVVDYLKTLGFIENNISGNVLQILSELGTISCKRPDGRGYYSDAILTSLLRKNLKLHNIALYQSINESAIEFFRGLVKDNAAVTDDFYLQQYAYHALQSKDVMTRISALQEWFDYFRKDSPDFNMEDFRNYLSVSEHNECLNNLINEEKMSLDFILDAIPTSRP